MLKSASELPIVCPRRPAGSEVYEETLVKALARHFGTRLLLMDSLLLPGGSTAKEADLYKDCCRPEKDRIIATRSLVVASLRHKKLASSVEADMSTGSVIVPQRPPKQEASTASSRKYTFKEGDSLTFVGSMHSGVAPQLPSSGITKNVVVAAACISLKYSNVLKYASDFPSVSEILCKPRSTERAVSFIIEIDITGGKGAVQVNGRVHNTSSSPLTVTGGDELIFGSAGVYAYIFEQLSCDTVAVSALPTSLAIFEAQTAPDTGEDTKAGGRDSCSSAVAGASILASLSIICKRLSRLPLSRSSDEDSVSGSLSRASDNGICDVDMNDIVDHEDYNAASLLNQKEVGPVSDGNTNIDDVAKDTGLDTEEGMAPSMNNELSPFL